MKTQEVKCVPSRVLHWHGGYQNGWILRCREQFLDGMLMGWTLDEVKQNIPQLEADRIRVGLPIKVVIQS